MKTSLWLSIATVASALAQSRAPELQAAIGAAAIYKIEPAGGGFVASNPAQDLTVRFNGGSTDFIHRTGRFTLSLAGEEAISRASARENRVEFAHGGVTEWFVNGAAGVEQGFTVASKRSVGPLVLTLDVTGDYAPAFEDGDVVLRRDSKTLLRYAGLRSWDARGRSLLSHAVVEDYRIRLVVDDSTASYPVTIDPVVEEVKFTGSDTVAGDQFGLALAVSGNTAVAGVQRKNFGAGGAYVLIRSGNVWTEQQKLTISDGSTTFGTAVAVEGDTAVVSALYQADLTGAVYVFTRAAGQWTQQAKLTAFDGAQGDAFGSSVAISGDTIVVGASGATPAQGGSVGYANRGQTYIFTRSGITWSYQAKLLGSGSLLWSDFGTSVAVSGDTTVIGASGTFSSGTHCGAAWVFLRSGTLWTEQARLTAPDCLGSTQWVQSWRFGAGVAVSGDTAMIGAPGSQQNQTGAVYFFTRSGLVWTPQATVAPIDAATGDEFGGAVALSGDVAVAGAKAKTYQAVGDKTGAAYLLVRVGGMWNQMVKLMPAVPPLGSNLGSSVTLSGDTVLVGAPSYNGAAGAAYSFRFSNISLQSSPPGRTFILSGPGCGLNGSFAAPYTGYWINCTVQWTSPDTASPGTRYSFQSWQDGPNQNPRTFTPLADPTLPAVSYTGNFQTEFLLTTQAVPVSGGSVTGAGWYEAGTNATIMAVPNSGFVFTGFSGGLTGVALPGNLTMNSPQTVTGAFTNTPPAVMTGIVSAKSGPSSGRLWTIALTNGGPGTAYGAQVFVLAFTQTFGTPCTAMPSRIFPAVLPVTLGTLAPGAGAQMQSAIDFSACPLNARFTVNVGYMSNGGASGGLIQLVNQFQ